jgi:hypothetical protein
MKITPVKPIPRIYKDKEKTMQQYEIVYKNVSPVARTTDEAFKTADYATPIWRCENDTDKGIKFLVNMVIGMLMVAVPLVAVYSFVLWLDSVK